MVKVRQKLSGSVCGMNNKSGFTLIEIMVALVLIGILATFVVPNLQRSVPSYERKKFISHLNALFGLAWQNAVVSRAVHKVSFDFGKKKVSIAAATDAQTREGKPVFKPMQSPYLKTSLDIPDNLQIKNFFIEGFDELSRYAGGTATAESWFYIVPEGLTQPIIINLIDTKELLGDGKPEPVGLVLNPFTAQLKEYDTFQK